MATYGTAKSTMRELVAHWRAYSKRMRATPQIVNVGIREIKADPKYWSMNSWSNLLAQIDAGTLKNPRRRRAKNPLRVRSLRRSARWDYWIAVNHRSGELHIFNEYRGRGRETAKAFARDNGFDDVIGPFTSRAKAIAKRADMVFMAAPGTPYHFSNPRRRTPPKRRKRSNPVEISKPGREGTPFRVYTRSRERPKWGLTVKSYSLAKAISVAMKMRAKGYGIRITGPRELMRHVK